MKPSQRRDSLEKAARKGIVKLDAVESPLVGDVVQFVASFAQRHGAKVRRECAELALGYTKGDRKLYELILTPRGPEKGRTGK